MSLINKITIRVIAVFMTAILTSFIPDTFPEFFGDVKCAGSVYVSGEGVVGCRMQFVGEVVPYEHAPSVHWGYRHYLWNWMSVVLGLVQAFGIVTMTYNHLEKNESR